ncbi:MAG: DUF4189 domain-containing protein [Halioglobus sp.]
MSKVRVVCSPVRQCLDYFARALAVPVLIVAFAAVNGMAWADQGGNIAICRQQCNYDSGSSCYSSCMADRNLYDSAPGGTMGPMPAPPTLFGAIAVDIDSLATGYVKDVASREDAESGALAQCRKAGGSASGCEIAVWGHNICLALSTSLGGSNGNTWGYAWSDDGWVSRRDAVNACRKEGGSSCKVAVSFCTG